MNFLTTLREFWEPTIVTGIFILELIGVRDQLATSKYQKAYWEERINRLKAQPPKGLGQRNSKSSLGITLPLPNTPPTNNNPQGQSVPATVEQTTVHTSEPGEGA